jgi:hypothetical protein
MALTLDGNGTMTVGNGDITGLVAGALPSTVIGAGAVLQVVQGIFTSTFSSTSATYVATGITATITPSSATSKILIFVSTTAGISTTSDSYYFSIFKDSTNLSYATGYTVPAMARQYQATSTASDGFQMNLSYLDSPATTSATTYTLRIRNDGSSSTMYIGRIVSSTDPHGGVIQLMEISG